MNVCHTKKEMIKRGNTLKAKAVVSVKLSPKFMSYFDIQDRRI